jgi:hypothetical protein
VKIKVIVVFLLFQLVSSSNHVQSSFYCRPVTIGENKMVTLYFDYLSMVKSNATSIRNLPIVLSITNKRVRKTQCGSWDPRFVFSRNKETDKSSSNRVQ